jgi:potassium/hydrogen antiporter
LAVEELTAFAALVARPLAVGPLLLPTRLRRKEQIFVIWGGYAGRCRSCWPPFAVLAAVDDADRLYDIVFVVAFSVIVQGSSIPFVARRLGIPMRQV